MELFEEGVITWKKGIHGSSDTLLLLDKANGNVKWEWGDYIRPGAQKGSAYYKYYHDGIWCYDSHQDNYGINLSTGKTTWSINIDHLQTFITGNAGGLVFKTKSIRENEISASILVGEAKTGNFHEVFKHEADSGYNLVSIPNVSSYTNHNGETILVFFVQQEGWLNGKYETEVDYCAFNLDTQKMLWRRESLNRPNGANKTPPVIDEGAVYVGGEGIVFKLDKTTGETIWQKELPAQFDLDKYTQYKDRLIFNLGNGDLIAISKKDGATIWHNKGLSGCCATPIVRGERIYFANGGLHIVDVSTGEEKYEFLPSQGTYFVNPAVDLENKRMYGTDGVYFYAWELPN